MLYHRFFLLFIFLLGLLLIGCQISPKPQKVIIESNNTNMIINKAQEEYITDSEINLNNYSSVSCWNSNKSINCEIRKTYFLINKLNRRIEDTLNGWGGCCDE
jgi:hypothetical protein